MPLFSKLGRTYSKIILGSLNTGRSFDVLIGGDKGVRGMISERIIELLMELSIINCR